jgi:hypothetical protein
MINFLLIYKNLVHKEIVMPAQVKIFTGIDSEVLNSKINQFLNRNKLNRDQVTIKQSQSSESSDSTRVWLTITLLYDE